MVDRIRIQGVIGWFSPTDREHINDGEYFRIPDGRVFLLKSYLPKTLIELVDPASLPQGTIIIDVITPNNS